MKKFLALLLAAMMLLSCATAMAAPFDSVTNDQKPSWLDEVQVNDNNADIDVRVPNVNYDSGKNTYGKEGTAATELWLQVDATGQIDVTVPLVLVFQTNIDGGQATSPSDYKITNHSSADLVVTKIENTVIPKSAEDAKTQFNPMSMLYYNAGDWFLSQKTEDKYAVQLRYTDTNGKLGQDPTYYFREPNNGTFDLFASPTGKKVTLYQNAAHKGGLFELKKALPNQNDAGTDTALAVDMKTGRLSFVTNRAENDPDSMDMNKGIHLMTLTYTVAIDTSEAIGDEITNDTNMTQEGRILYQNLTTQTNLDDNANDPSDTRIGEVTSSRAKEQYNND